MRYEQPIIQKAGTVDAFLNLFVQRTPSPPSRIDWRVKRIKDLVDRAPGEIRSSLDGVCKELGLPMSGRQARRLFKACMGTGIRTYIRNKKLAVAAEQLQATDAPVKAIAADVGYQSTRDFARSFKELFRLSPIEFRIIWRQRRLFCF
jgi:transcriptional regulator GlxA family with amidase domain